MKEENIKKHISNAMNCITPDIFEKVKTAPIEKIQEQDIVFKGNRTDVKDRVIYCLAAVCAACFIGIIGLNIINGKVVTTIDIDVNPSFEITADKSDHVIDVIPLNSDGKIILDNMNMKNVDLNVAVNAIIGSMVKNGYLNEVKNAILISVENKDQIKANQLRSFLTEDISSSLSAINIEVTVYNQEIKKDKSLDHISKKYGISLGKASFLEKLIQKSGNLTYEELVPLSMEELTDMIIEKNIDLQGLIEQEEDESLRENIEDALEDIEEEDELEDEDDSGDEDDLEDHSEDEDDSEGEDD